MQPFVAMLIHLFLYGGAVASKIWRADREGRLAFAEVPLLARTNRSARWLTTSAHEVLLPFPRLTGQS